MSPPPIANNVDNRVAAKLGAEVCSEHARLAHGFGVVGVGPEDGRLRGLRTNEHRTRVCGCGCGCGCVCVCVSVSVCVGVDVGGCGCIIL